MVSSDACDHHMHAVHNATFSLSVPVLRGRTAIDVFAAFMESFRDEFDGWMGNTITECLIGETWQVFPRHSCS